MPVGGVCEGRRRGRFELIVVIVVVVIFSWSCLEPQSASSLLPVSLSFSVTLSLEPSFSLSNRALNLQLPLLQAHDLILIHEFPYKPQAIRHARAR